MFRIGADASSTRAGHMLGVDLPWGGTPNACDCWDAFTTQRLGPLVDRYLRACVDS